MRDLCKSYIVLLTSVILFGFWEATFSFTLGIHIMKIGKISAKILEIGKIKAIF